MRIIAIACLLVSALAAGCADQDGTTTTTTTTDATTTAPTSGPRGENEVILLDHTFVPKELNVTAGTTLTFLNQGASPHTVTIHHAEDPVNVQLKNETLDSGEQTTHTFVAPGTYHVWCRFHGEMTSDMAMVVRVT